MIFAVNAGRRRAQEGAACWTYVSPAQAGAVSCKGTAETQSLWPQSLRDTVLGIRKSIAFLMGSLMGK